MNTLNSLKDKGKQSVSHLVQLGQEQPSTLQHWGITAAAAVAGAVALTAAAKGLLGIIGTLATPAVSLTVGAVAGGALGWGYFQQQNQAKEGATATVVNQSVAATSAPTTAEVTG